MNMAASSGGRKLFRLWKWASGSGSGCRGVVVALLIIPSKHHTLKNFSSKESFKMCNHRGPLGDVLGMSARASTTASDDPQLVSELAKMAEHSASKRPFGYYEALGIPRSSKVGDIKHAYFRMAKKYHPDAFPMNDGDEDQRESRRTAKIARFKFDEITEAYQTLMDVTQRSFYDMHGYPLPQLRQGPRPTIFDYVPRFGLYEEHILEDHETTQMEDWLAAQGHSTRDPKIGLRQRLKNSYIELRYGLAYYNFPWKIKEFIRMLLVVTLVSIAGTWTLVIYIRWKMDSLPLDHPSRPISLNDRWRNDEVRDILSFVGIRKRFPSEEIRASLRHSMPREATIKDKDKTVVDKEPIKFSELVYKNWRQGFLKSTNLERHQERLRESRDQNLDILAQKKQYWEDRLESLASERESLRFMVPNQDASHTASSIALLDSQIKAVMKKLDEVHLALEKANVISQGGHDEATASNPTMLFPPLSKASKF